MSEPHNTSNMSLAIDIQDLTFSFNKQTILSIPHWSMPRGKKVLLSGASGSGKSTFINILAGTLVAVNTQASHVTILGTDISALSASKRDKFRASNVGIIFQQFNLIPYLSVSDNIVAANYFANKPTDNLLKEISILLERLGLPSNIGSQRADSISVGQQQRVAIARALINKPALLIADEPTSALDANARNDFMQLLIEQSNLLNISLLFVSHDRTLTSYFDAEVVMTDINLASAVK